MGFPTWLRDAGSPVARAGESAPSPVTKNTTTSLGLAGFCADTGVTPSWWSTAAVPLPSAVVVKIPGAAVSTYNGFEAASQYSSCKLPAHRIYLKMRLTTGGLPGRGSWRLAGFSNAGALRAAGPRESIPSWHEVGCVEIRLNADHVSEGLLRADGVIRFPVQTGSAFCQ